MSSSSEWIDSKQGSLLPALTVQFTGLATSSGTLSGCTVALYARKADGSLLVDGAEMTVDDAADSRASHAWADAEADHLGSLELEFVITETASGKTHKVPELGFVRFRRNPTLSPLAAA